MPLHHVGDHHQRSLPPGRVGLDQAALQHERAEADHELEVVGRRAHRRTGSNAAGETPNPGRGEAWQGEDQAVKSGGQRKSLLQKAREGSGQERRRRALTRVPFATVARAPWAERAQGRGWTASTSRIKTNDLEHKIVATLLIVGARGLWPKKAPLI